MIRRAASVAGVLSLALTACGPNRSIADSTAPDVSGDGTDVGVQDVATDVRHDVALDALDGSASDAVSDVAPDTRADVSLDAPPDVAADTRPDVTVDVLPDVPLDVTTLDAGDPCAGLDIRPDLNANAVPDCRENLLANGQFPMGIAPWMTTARATITWSTTDALAFATSGSALVTDIVASTTVNGGSVDAECVPVAPSANYGMYTQYFMASGEPGGDAAAATWITVQTYLDSGCTMPHSGISGGTLGSTKDVWAVYTRHITTTATEHSIRLSLGVLKGATASPVSASFDNVLLVRE